MIQRLIALMVLTFSAYAAYRAARAVQSPQNIRRMKALLRGTDTHIKPPTLRMIHLQPCAFY